MNNQIYRCYTEKKPNFDIVAKSIQRELSEQLMLPEIQVRFFSRYDVQGVPAEKVQDVFDTIIAAADDTVYADNLPDTGADRLLYAEPVPGQYLLLLQESSIFQH
jgi:phosphoribosylformylglycinamidine synthase